MIKSFTPLDDLINMCRKKISTYDSPRLPVSQKIVKKHVTNDQLFKGGNHSYSLPLLRGGLGWGSLFMQKRDAPKSTMGRSHFHLPELGYQL